MKKIAFYFLLFVFMWTNAKELSPFVKIGEVKGSIEEVQRRIIKRLSENRFEILGHYNPGKLDYMSVIVFTRSDLKNVVVSVQDRGALAAVMKIGLLVVAKNTVEITYTNPEYIACAYLGDDYKKYTNSIERFHKSLKLTLLPFSQNFESFGGKLDESKLAKYRYMPMMPNFDKPITIREFSSFKKGLETISKNLKDKVDKTELVYVLLYPEKNIAVFGVAINNSMTGSEFFYLPKIGEKHLAAMPYEIILQDKTASILNAKYRLALFWPDLKMSQFVKIISVPSSLKQTFQRVCEDYNF